MRLGQRSVIKKEADSSLTANSTSFGSHLCQRLPQESLERENIAEHKEEPEAEERGRVHGAFPLPHSFLEQQHQELQNQGEIHSLQMRNLCLGLPNQVGLGKTADIYP